MHMADALLSPGVGGVMTVAGMAAVGFSAKKMSGGEPDEKIVPVMGVMGAFVFAAQMINFTIPGTGSSGHIGGGMLLAALLGPYPALITLAAVLLIQCLFFADGGLLAYGCNVFNLGVCTCLLAYPLIFKPLTKKELNKRSITLASVISVVAGLQLGSFFVVFETWLSGVAELPFGAFLAFMQPIHLLIGLAEGIVTAAVLCFVYNARPELLKNAAMGKRMDREVSTKRILLAFMAAAVLTGGVLSLFASSLPDGLEWSVQGVTGSPELERDGALLDAAERVVDATAILPDYGFADEEIGTARGTATAGIAGAAITVALVGIVGFAIRKAGQKKL